MKLYRHFLRFRPRIRFICERSAENETMQFGGRYGFGSVSVQIRLYVKQPLIKQTNVILTSNTQRRLGKYTVSPGHSLAHRKNAVDRDSDKNEDLV